MDLDGPPLDRWWRPRCSASLGCRFDPTHTQAVADTHGFGLTSMRERLQAIGGQLTLRSAPGAGTRIQAQVAVQAPP